MSTPRSIELLIDPHSQLTHHKSRFLVDRLSDLFFPAKILITSSDPDNLPDDADYYYVNQRDFDVRVKLDLSLSASDLSDIANLVIVVIDLDDAYLDGSIYQEQPHEKDRTDG